MVKSSSATAVSDSTESASSAATVTAKPQSKRPDGSAKPPVDAADKKNEKLDVAPAEERMGNSPPLSIASSDDICEYNLFSDEDTESDASLGELSVYEYVCMRVCLVCVWTCV